jgi:hypothetical protein
MTFSRAVLLGTLAWVSLISFLHASLNWGLFDAAPPEREARAKFKVGFLPVT